MKKTMTFLLTVCYISCFSQINDGLVAFYPFCGNADDASLNDNNAIINGASLTEDRFGNSDSAYLFDGIDDFMEIENSQDLENLENQLTLSVWFKTIDYYSTGNNWAILLTKSGNSSSGNSRQFSVYYKDNGDIYFNSDVIGNFTFDLNIWYNLTVTYDSGTVKTYVDGDLINDLSGANIITTNQLSLMFGYDAPGVVEYYDGTLDDIRIYDRILDGNEISELTTGDLGCTVLNVDPFGHDNMHIKLYPNPSEGKVIVATDSNNEKILECYDLNGTLIFKKNFRNATISIDIDHLNSGLYFFKISSQRGIEYRKIIKR